MSWRLLLCALLTLGLSAADEDQWLRPLGKPPPKPKPPAESKDDGERDQPAVPEAKEPTVTYPALPLPKGAQGGIRLPRKQESNPAPPTLVGKVIWGADATFTWDTGDQVTVSDWNQCPNDVASLLGRAGDALGLTYQHVQVNLASFHFDPIQVPLLLISGSRSIQLDPTERQALRRYVQDGGMLVFDAIAGSPWFHQAVVGEVAAMFPEQRLRAVPLDHPLLHAVHDCSTVRYKGTAQGEAPRLQAVYVGSRIGVLVSPYGLGTGWDGRDVYGIEQAAWYAVDSAQQLGVNLVAYAVGYAEPGRIEARPELHGSSDAGPADELVFAQLRHGGAWNVHPGAAAALMMRARRELALDVAVRRVAVDAATEDLSAYGVVYLTALDEFRFSDAEVAALRDFLDANGTLIVNVGLGLPSADAVLRREVGRLIPGAEIERLPGDHPIATAAYPLESVRYTPAVLATEGQLDQPVVEGIAIDGDLRVIYLPYSVEAAWLGCEYPLARAYVGVDGVRMGLNILTYAATH